MKAVSSGGSTALKEPSKAEIAQRKAAADRTAAKIQANPADLARLGNAVKTNNVREAKTILATNGLDASNVRVMLRDETAGKANARIKKVTVEYG